jgi:hypothetical protein
MTFDEPIAELHAYCVGTIAEEAMLAVEDGKGGAMSNKSTREIFYEELQGLHAKIECLQSALTAADTEIERLQAELAEQTKQAEDAEIEGVMLAGQLTSYKAIVDAIEELTPTRELVIRDSLRGTAERWVCLFGQRLFVGSTLTDCLQKAVEAKREAEGK